MRPRKEVALPANRCVSSSRKVSFPHFATGSQSAVQSANNLTPAISDVERDALFQDHVDDAPAIVRKVYNYLESVLPEAATYLQQEDIGDRLLDQVIKHGYSLLVCNNCACLSTDGDL